MFFALVLPAARMAVPEIQRAQVMLAARSKRRVVNAKKWRVAALRARSIIIKMELVLFNEYESKACIIKQSTNPHPRRAPLDAAE